MIIQIKELNIGNSQGYENAVHQDEEVQNKKMINYYEQKYELD